MRHDEPASMMHLIRPVLLLVALLVMLAAAELASADTARVHEVAGTAGPAITLAQVAELTGEYAESLADVEIAQLPANEGETAVKIDQIEQALRNHGASMGRLDLIGYGSCRVVRIERPEVEPAAPEETTDEPGVVVSPERRPVTVRTPATVREDVWRQVAMGLGLERSEIEIEFRDRDAELLGRSIVAGRYRVEPALRIGLGATTFRVVEYQGTQRRSEQTLRVTVRQRVLAVVAVEPIERGSLIGRHQVRVRETLVDGDAGFVVSETDLVVGQVASRTLRPGELVTAGAVQAALAVRRRAVVDVVYLRNGVRINFAAKALEEGSVGDTVEVEHQDTRETFAAEIIGENRVRVGAAPQEESGE